MKRAKCEFEIPGDQQEAVYTALMDSDADEEQETAVAIDAFAATAEPTVLCDRPGESECVADYDEPVALRDEDEARIECVLF